MATLRRLDGQGRGVAEFQLGAETWIGRAPENDIVLDSNDVSRRHARVVKTEHGFLVMDNGSQNGVVVRGQRVPRHVLVHGDIITIGSVALEFVDAPELGATVVLERPPAPPRATRPAPPPPPVAVPALPQSPPPAPVATPTSPPAVTPAAPAQKKGCGFKGCLLGCLAAFVLLGLLLFSAYVYFVKPPWAGRLQFWRTSLHPELELGGGAAPGGESVDLAAIDAQVAASKKARAELDQTWDLDRANYVRKTVSASTGDRLQTVHGATLEIPPYALDHDATVELAPRAGGSLREERTEDLRPVSDVYVIRVDGQEHTQFQRPLVLEVPARLDIDGRPVAAEEIGAYSWNGSAWERYPGAVTIAGDKVRFEIEHATDIVAGIGAFLGGLGSVSGTRSELEPWAGWVRFAAHPAYRTANFAVYYVAPDPSRTDAVPADSAYPGTAGRKSGEHPYYAVDVGDALQSAMANAPRVGVEPSSGLWASKRFTAMIEPSGAFGVTPLGGPIYIDNKMDGVTPGIDYTEFVKTTAVHELMHVVQDEYFNTKQTIRPSTASFMETTAQALSDLLRHKTFPKEHPSPYFATNHYLVTMPDFIRTPIDAEGRGEKALSYAWGAFLIWLEIDGGYPQFTSAAMKRKAAFTQFAGVPVTMAQVAAEMSPGRSLSDAFSRFAVLYLHDDMWENKLHTAGWWRDRSNLAKLADQYAHQLIFRTPNGTEESANYFFARQAQALDHMTARLDVFDGTALTNNVPGKLYLRIHDVAKSGAQIIVFADQFNQLTPIRKGERSDLRLTTGTDQTVEIANFGNHAPTIPMAVSNRLNLVVMNDQPGEDGQDFAYDVWILLPPSNVTFDKQTNAVEAKPTGQFVVKWSRSPLEKAKTTFRGYNVYRRKLGDAAWPATPVNANPIAETLYVDSPPDQFDYEYAVTTLDTFTHESEKSMPETDDPFAGEWSGSFVLKSGTLLDESKLSDEDKETYAGVIPILRKFEALLKLGVQVRFRLARSEGTYYFQPISIYGKSVNAGESSSHFDRITQHNLQWIDEKPSPEDTEKPPPPLYFSLEYPDEIHNTYSRDDLTLEWRFVRASKKSP